MLKEIEKSEAKIRSEKRSQQLLSKDIIEKHSNKCIQPYLFKYYLLKIDTFYYSSFTIFRTYFVEIN